MNDISPPVDFTLQAGPSSRSVPEPIPFRLAQAFSRIMCSTLFDMKVWGTRNFPRRGGVLVVSNHQSFLDPVLLGAALPRSLSYMAKSELFEVNPLFTWLIRSLGAFPVRQGGSAAGAIKETIDRLQEGRALNIYPEGTRTATGEIMAFEKGIALVVRRAKVPVVPAAIHGSFETYPSGTKVPWPRPIRIMYGRPLLLHDLKPDQIIQTLEKEIRVMHVRLLATDPRSAMHIGWARDRVKRERAETRRSAGRF